MNNCRKCSGKGIIKRPYSLYELSLMEWILVLSSFVTVIALVQIYGESHGLVALTLVAMLVILVPAIQLCIWILGMLGVIKRSITCPECKGEK